MLHTTRTWNMHTHDDIPQMWHMWHYLSLRSKTTLLIWYFMLLKLSSPCKLNMLFLVLCNSYFIATGEHTTKYTVKSYISIYSWPSMLEPMLDITWSISYCPYHTMSFLLINGSKPSFPEDAAGTELSFF